MTGDRRPESGQPAADPMPGRGDAIGGLLVGLQLASIAMLAWFAAPAFLRGSAPGVAWLAALGGVALGAWAISANRPGNFNIHPSPRAGGRLVEAGPYRWIRHPMYSAVIACGIGAAAAIGSLPAWGAVLLLWLVLHRKSLLEERWMVQAHPGYRDYGSRTGRFVPGIGRLSA